MTTTAAPRPPRPPQPSQARLFWSTARTIATRRLTDAGRDLVPVFAVIAFFQLVVLRQSLPDLFGILLGVVAVVVGLALFVQGLEIALFPLGETMADAFARKGSVFWLLTFAFALGFATTVAEPALIAITAEAGEVAAEAGLIEPTAAGIESYAFAMRTTVALAVGTAVLLGVLRILKGWPVHVIIMAGYAIVSLLTFFAPPSIVGVAFDSGGVTTSTVTVPLVTALGVGLATTIRRRDPMIDGFGLIALASLLPIIFVLGFGMVLFGTGGEA